jgi:hypothetical protein
MDQTVACPKQGLPVTPQELTSQYDAAAALECLLDRFEIEAVRKVFEPTQ